MRTTKKLAFFCSAAVALALALSACNPTSGISTAQEEKNKVTKARQIIEAAGLEFTTLEFREDTCKTDPPFAAYTGWRSEVEVDGGKTAAKAVSQAFSAQGWTQNENSWTDGEKLNPNGFGNSFYSDSYFSDDSYVSIEIFKDRPKTTYVIMTTPCKEQPADREMEKDPEHPESYGGPPPASDE